jgi:pimeloyl-ACP methyl ester carboxylesterase
MATALLLILLPFGLSLPGPPKAFPSEQEQTPVLLLPGFLMNRSSMWLLAFYLRRRGWRWVWAINNRPNTPIPVMAQELGLRIEELERVSGARQVDIVAHSMGGIIAAWYAAKLGGDAHIRQLITLGTPWKGTRMHIWGPAREARDLAPQSEVIAQAQTPPIPVSAIWSPVDQLLVPSDCAHCEAKENLQLEQCGHMEMLLSARVFRLVREILGRTSGASANESP